MKRAAEKVRGFTLVELIVVIAIIGILATITVIGFGKFQADTRDARRASSATVITEALEKYYDQNGEYPSCGAITGDAATVTQTILKNVDQKTLVAPQATGETNSIKCTSAGNVLATNGADFFEYQGDGSAECAGSGACLNFTFKYRSEGDNTIKSISSRRTTDIATSGDITDLQANSTSFSTIALSWSSVNNASSYTIQMANDSSFSSPTITSSPTAGASVGGLVAGNTYYFRVQPVNGTATGKWSNTSSATTRSLATPVGKVVASNATTVTFSWNAISLATGYRVQRGTSSAFGAGTYTETTQTGVSIKYTDEAAGVTHYYRVIATATGDTSDPSAVVSMTTASPPAAYSISESDPDYNTIIGTSAAKCATGTTLYYKWTKQVNSGSYAALSEGTTYKSVNVSLGWDQTVNLNSSARCQSSTYTSAYTASNNTIGRHLSSPTATAGIGPARTFTWTGTCPEGATSKSFSWKVVGDGNVNASGTSSAAGQYANTGNAWGDGNGRVTLSCYSAAPYGWSGAVTAASRVQFGGGCVPTITKSICTAN